MSDEACSTILARCARAEISPAIAAMELLLATGSLARALTAVRAHEGPGAPIRAVLRLLDEHPVGAEKVASMLAGDVDSVPGDASPEERVAVARRLFDAAVACSEVASVALYSLGSEEILAEATREIVAWLDRVGLLEPGRDALDLGCGIGRMEIALAPRLGTIHGVDVSPGMIAAAQRRCAGIPNVRISLVSGLDLAGFAAGSFDLMLAVDSVPYLVEAGAALVRAHFREAERVLRGRGDLVILNYAYGLDADEQRASVRALAAESGLSVVIDGEAPFTLWNARAFVIKKT